MTSAAGSIPRLMWDCVKFIHKSPGSHFGRPAVNVLFLSTLAPALLCTSGVKITCTNWSILEGHGT